MPYSIRLIFLTVLSAVLAVPLFSQDFGLRSREGRGFGGQSPWMQGGYGGGRMMVPPDGSPFGGGQPPWMNRERGGERDGRSDADRNERTLGMLRAMDTNGNGVLDPNEVPEYRKRFVDMMVSRLGGDPSKPVNLNDLARRAASSGSSGSSSGSSRSGSTSPSSSDNKNTGDPLVPAFGEKEETRTPVLEFGQNEPAVKKPAVSTSAAAVNQSDQILRSAREIMNKYDKNKNGTLDKDKNEWTSSLPFNADKADKNRDGRISMQELIAALGGQSGVSAGAAAVLTKSSTPYDRLPPGMPDWFIERDKNQDAQLTMLEYANGQPLSETIADEFRFLDKNNDGIATLTEIFETLKQVDEEKRRKEEQAQREKERLQGGIASATPAGTPPQPAPEGQPAPPPDGTPQGVPPQTTPVPQENVPSPAVPPSSTAPAAPASAPSTAPYSSGTVQNEKSNRHNSREYRGSRSTRYER